MVLAVLFSIPLLVPQFDNGLSVDSAVFVLAACMACLRARKSHCRNHWIGGGGVWRVACGGGVVWREGREEGKGEGGACKAIRKLVPGVAGVRADVVKRDADGTCWRVRRLERGKRGRVPGCVRRRCLEQCLPRMCCQSECETS